ncbi:peptidase family m1 domain-containing protein [Phthorimaea operculella]|nr:peptidase family m1 domain-containing protein [Phthorimaea operculella]
MLVYEEVRKHQYVIRMSFRKMVKKDASSGIFVVPYDDDGPKLLYVTRLSPHKAKYFFPCFANPRFEALFKFKVYLSRMEHWQYNTSLVISKEQRRYQLDDRNRVEALFKFKVYLSRMEHWQYNTSLVISKEQRRYQLDDRNRYKALFKFKVYLSRMEHWQYNTSLVISKEQRRYQLDDRNRYKALFKFKVYLSRMEHWQYNTSLVISKEQSRYQLDDRNRKYDVIEYIPSPQVTLNQVGFHYSQFGSRQITARNYNDTIVIWAPTRDLRNYDYIMNFGSDLLNRILQYSQDSRSLVYGPINIVAVPNHIDGYEIYSWNLLTNGITKLAYLAEFTSIRQMEQMKYELALQMSRIWLGNPGELKRTRWKEEWFKEGFATYLGHYFLIKYLQTVTNPQYKLSFQKFGLQMRHKAMAADEPYYHVSALNPSSRSLVLPPSLISLGNRLVVDVSSRDLELVQMKTASLLWMIENWIGSEKFHQAIVEYMRTRRSQYITLKDFLSSLDRHTVECLNQKFNASGILDSWFTQSGYPVVHVDVQRSRTPNVVTLQQTQFSIIPHSSSNQYLIPVTYMVENCLDCTEPKFVIHDNDKYSFQRTLNDQWIILNVNGSGYYRVNYDRYSWQLIAKTLRGPNRETIPEINRAQIVNDVFALYAGGYMDHTLAVELLDYLDVEASPVVWDAAIAGFELMKTPEAKCRLTKTVYKEWKHFMSTKVESIFYQLRESESRANSYTLRMFRHKVFGFACSVEYHPCIQHFRDYYSQRHRVRINPDTRDAYYAVAANERDFENLGFNAFETEDKIIAERRINKEKILLYSLPEGSSEIGYLYSSTPSPMSTDISQSLSQSTASPKDCDGSSTKPNKGASSHFSSALAVVFSALILSTFR